MPPTEGPTEEPHVDVVLKDSLAYTEHGHELLKKVDPDGKKLGRFHQALDVRNENGGADDELAEGFVAMDRSLEGRIAKVRLTFNNLTELGIGLASINQQPLDAGDNPIAFDDEVRRLTGQTKAQTDGLIAAILKDEPRVKVGFMMAPDKAEWLHDVACDRNRLTAAVSEDPQILNLNREMSVQPDNVLIAQQGQLITVRLLLLDKIKLGKIAEGAGVTYESLDDERGPHSAQRYTCRYLVPEVARDLAVIPRVYHWMLYKPSRAMAEKVATVRAATERAVT